MNTPKRKYTNVNLNDSNFKVGEGIYTGVITPIYCQPFNYKFRYCEPVKKIQLKNGGESEIHAELEVEGLRRPVGIFKGDKGLSGSAKDSDGNLMFYVNVKPVLSASAVKSFELAIVEKYRDEEANTKYDVKVEDVLPF